jgi:hypothetical protein
VSEFDNEVNALAIQYGMLIKENADLRAKLEAADKIIKEILTTLTPFMKKNFPQDKDTYDIVMASKDLIKKHNDLQEQVGVLCETLGFITKSETVGYVKMIAESALELTPPEAGERVRGLVAALEEIKARCEHPKSEDDAHYENYYEAKNALTKYRGGATNA